MFSTRIGTRRLAQYCRRVGTSLEAGVEVRRVMQRELERASWGERASMQRISQAVAGGQNMTDAFTAVDGFFPPMVRGMVQVGEEAGKLDQAFLRLADHFERQLSLRRIFLAGIIWPVIQFVAAVFIIGFLIWIMGWIGEMATKQGGKPVDILGLGLMGTRGLMIYIAIVSGLGIAGVLVYKAATAGLRWFTPLQRFLLALPVLGNSLRTLALARIAWTLAVTTNTSMDAIRAVTLALRNSQSLVYASQVDHVAGVIRKGRPISEALRSAGGYPSEFLDTLEVGEETGSVSESMERLSRLYEERAKAALAALTVLAGFVVWGLVALIIAAAILRLGLFYTNMLTDLANGKF